MNKNQKLSKEILEKHNINTSYYRIVILEQIIKSKKCLKIDEIYKTLYNTTSTISKATLYNNLMIFEKHNILNKIIFNQDEIYYCLNDGNIYLYFKCEICNNIYKFPIDLQCFNSINKEGNQINSYNIASYGICKKCLK